MEISLNRLSAPFFIRKNANAVNNKYPNLSPLKADTVSFSGSAKVESGIFSEVAGKNKCVEVHDYAEPALYYLQTVLDKYIGPLAEEKTGKGYKTPYLTYTSKLKTPTSIREKIASKYSKITGDNSKKFIKDVSSLIAEYFPLQKGASKNNIIAIVSRSVQDKQKTCKMPPFVNAKVFLDDIRELLENSNIIDTTEMTPTQINSIYENIEDTITTIIPNEEHNDGKTYFNPKTRTGIIHYANDICQSRIVMLKPEKEYTSRVLSALESAVKDGVLKITSVENNLPDEDKIPDGKTLADYEYVDEASLRKFAKSTKSEYKRNISKSGYLGIHINVDLSNSFLDPICNGYTGEIQIIGQDVLELKHVEDLCYKIKDFKDVEKRGYGPFKMYFEKYYDEKTNGQAFSDYTYSLYLAQRSLPPSKIVRTAFPSVKDLGYEGKGIDELDYNNLRVIKMACDIERKNDEEKERQEIEAKTKPKAIAEKDTIIANNRGRVSFFIK